MIPRDESEAWNATDTDIEDEEILSNASKPLRVQCMHIAESLTLGDRNADYGDPYDSLKPVADAYNVLRGSDLKAADIALIYMLGKMRRMATSPLKKDNYVDLIAYAGIALECEVAERKKPAV